MMLQFAYDFWRLKEDLNAEKEIARIENVRSVLQYCLVYSMFFIVLTKRCKLLIFGPMNLSQHCRQ